jgi:hypothetical protein
VIKIVPEIQRAFVYWTSLSQKTVRSLNFITPYKFSPAELAPPHDRAENGKPVKITDFPSSGSRHQISVLDMNNQPA